MPGNGSNGVYQLPKLAETEEEIQLPPGGKGAPTQLCKQNIIEALLISRGIVLTAARRLGVSYGYLFRFIRAYPELQDALKLARERAVDEAETSLFKSIKNGHVGATIFYLKTQGKHRGYVEDHHVTSDINVNLKLPQVNVIQLEEF